MKKNLFTLIELLVSTVISSWNFFAQKSAVATQQRIPLFLKKAVGFGERGKTSFPARAAGCGKTRPSVFVSLRRDESLRWGSDISSQSTPLFLKEKGGAGERENFFSREKKFSLSPAHSFTLIELLVVIAMIAILAAILLPALNSARERGRSASCVNNLKQFSTAFAMYQDNYDDYSCYGYIENYHSSAYRLGFHMMLGPYMGITDQYQSQAYLPTKTTARSEAVFLCPSEDNPESSTFNNSTGWYCHYAANTTYRWTANGDAPVVEVAYTQKAIYDNIGVTLSQLFFCCKEVGSGYVYDCWKGHIEGERGKLKSEISCQRVKTKLAYVFTTSVVKFIIFLYNILALRCPHSSAG